MKRCAVALFLLLATAGASLAQDVQLSVTGGDAKIVKVDRVIVVKDDLTVVSSFPFQIKAPPGGGLYFWSYPANVIAQDKGDQLEVTSAPKGRLTVGVKLITALLDKDGKFTGFGTKIGSVTFAVGDVPPPEPVPPIPDPKPEPIPDPKPNPAPIPLAGFRVLIVFESAEKAKYTSGQLAAIEGVPIRKYLEAKCVVEGPRKGFWILDKDVNVGGLAKHWQDAFARPRTGPLPWIVVSNGTAGWEGTLPATTAEVMNLLKKYGGE